jgi:hypothetical protein
MNHSENDDAHHFPRRARELHPVDVTNLAREHRRAMRVARINGILFAVVLVGGLVAIGYLLALLRG